MSSVRYVLASGDETGATDGAAIEAAITALEAAQPTGGVGTVLLSGGPYYTDRCFATGDYAGSVHSVRFVAAAPCTLYYVGSNTTEYQFRFEGDVDYDTAGPMLQNIKLYCNYNCRGVLFNHQVYRDLASNVIITRPYQVGADFVGCYKSFSNNLTVNLCTGIAVRVYASQGGGIDNLHIWNSLAGTEYAAFPSATDNTVAYSYDDTLIQTAETKRAPLYVYTSDYVFRSTMFQACSSLDTMPLVFLDFPRGVRFTEQFYMEANECDRQLVTVLGALASTSYMCRDVLFENVGHYNTHTCPTFIRAAWYVDWLRVHGIAANTVGQCTLTNVIQIDASTGHLYRSEVTGSRIGIASANRIVGTNDGTVEATAPYGLTFADVE